MGPATPDQRAALDSRARERVRDSDDARLPHSRARARPRGERHGFRQRRALRETRQHGFRGRKRAPTEPRADSDEREPPARVRRRAAAFAAPADGRGERHGGDGAAVRLRVVANQHGRADADAPADAPVRRRAPLRAAGAAGAAAAAAAAAARARVRRGERPAARPRRVLRRARWRERRATRSASRRRRGGGCASADARDAPRRRASRRVRHGPRGCFVRADDGVPVRGGAEPHVRGSKRARGRRVKPGSPGAPPRDAPRVGGAVREPRPPGVFPGSYREHGRVHVRRSRHGGGRAGAEAPAAGLDARAAQALRGRGDAPGREARRAQDHHAAHERRGLDARERGEPPAEVPPVPEAPRGCSESTMENCPAARAAAAAAAAAAARGGAAAPGVPTTATAIAAPPRKKLRARQRRGRRRV